MIGKLIGAAILGIGIALASGASALAQGGPIEVVQAFYAALNSGDVDTAMSYVAGDAQFINPNGTFTGADAIREALGTNVTDAVTFDLSNFKDADGRVTYDYVVKINGDPVETGTTGLTIIEDAKIVFDGTTDTEAQRTP